MGDLPLFITYESLCELETRDKEKDPKNLVTECQYHSKWKCFRKTAHPMESNSVENLICWAEKCNQRCLLLPDEISLGHT